MTRDEMVDFAAFAKCFPQTGPFFIADTYRRLRRLGREAHSYAERLCNYGERSEGEYERKTQSITRRALEAFTQVDGGSYGIEIETGGDPRGSCLKITIPRGSEGALHLRF